MNVYELTVKIYLLNNMKVNHIGYHIGNFINGAMKKDKDLSNSFANAIANMFKK